MSMKKPFLIFISAFILTILSITILLVFQPALLSSPFTHPKNTNTIGLHKIQHSDPTSVYIEEYTQYDRAQNGQRPIMVLKGTLSWYNLKGQTLLFFINTSDIIGDPQFWDYNTGDPGLIDIQLFHDRIAITPQTNDFSYEIKAYYTPDIVDHTNFIVIFQQQTVNFGVTYDSETNTAEYAPVDYINTIVLPEGAGIVSYAPTDAILFKEDGRYGLKWSYFNREMDSKHDPFIGEVTYAFDPIFLQFTELVYQQQMQQQKQQEQQDQLNMLNFLLLLFAIFSLLAALLAILIAYLLVRKQFESKLKKARELPRKAARDIESTESLKRKVASFFIIGIIVFSVSYNQHMGVVNAQTTTPTNVQWDGTLELFKDLTSLETVNIVLPREQSQLSIWANTSKVQEFHVYDASGQELQYVTYPDRFLVYNPGSQISYTIKQPYLVYNYSGILIYVDRFWLEFYDPSPDNPDIPYYKVDMIYNIVLPKDAIIYSASPYDLMTRSVEPDQRKKITFTSMNRQMDAFHNPFAMQISFSYEDVLDAIQNLNAEFENVRVETQNQEQLIQSTLQQLTLYALLAIITPILAFILAYYVFRKRFQKELERLLQQTEEQILVEEEQLRVLAQVSKTPLGNIEPWQSVLGSLRMLEFILGKIFHKNPRLLDISQIPVLLIQKGYKINIEEFNEVMSLTRPVQEMYEKGQTPAIDDDTAYDLIERLDILIAELWEQLQRK